jgi:hypothetical protein
MVDIRILEDWDYPTVISQPINTTKTVTPTATQTTTATATTAPVATDLVTLNRTQNKTVESDIIRAISGGTQADVDRAVQSVARVSQPQPTIEQQMATKANEDLAVRAISGGSEADVAAATRVFGATTTPVTVKDVVVEDGGDDKPDGAVDEGGTDEPPAGGVDTQFVEYEYTKDFTKRRAKFFNGKTGVFTYGEWEDAPKTKEDFDVEQARIAAEEAALNEKRDAFALVEATMRSYGFNEEELKEITDYISSGLINPKLGPNQLLLQLRQLESYKTRFAGNEQRRARGLNALSEAAYLAQERDYAQTLALYGQDRYANRQQFAQFIGNDISNTELGQRVALAVNRLQNADPAVLRQLSEYYPNINEKDIVSYFLSPDDALPELQVKTTTAEIGATARQYGLDYGMGRASELQQYGVDLERARAGFQNIARVLPRSEQLSDFYKAAGIDYDQTVAEQEEFKGLASARRARERLRELEVAEFSGQSGLTRGALGRQTGGSF